MDLGITGKTALVTGADSGIGWHTAKILLSEGARVIITDKDSDKLQEAASKLDAESGALFAFPADVTDLVSLAKLRENVEGAVGDIDILVQAAGITGAQGLFHEIDDAGWVDTIETDLLGPVRLVRTFLPALRKGGWGRIVLIGSEDAVQPYDDELPYWTMVDNKPHLVVPYTMSTNDSKFGRGTFATGDDFFHYCRDAFDFLYAEGRTQPKMLSIGLHMRLIGHPARAAGLQRLLDHIGRFDRVWMTRRLDIARHWATNFPPPVAGQTAR